MKHHCLLISEEAVSLLVRALWRLSWRNMNTQSPVGQESTVRCAVMDRPVMLTTLRRLSLRDEAVLGL